MKTFSQFMTEVYDKDVMGSSQIRKTGQRGEIGRDRRKTEPEKRRMKAAGGGKMVPAKSYKDRKDIGHQRGSQTPELKAGTAGTNAAAQAAAAKAERKKAALARIAARKAGKAAPKSVKLSNKEKDDIARKATQEPKKEVSPNYKPAKASGYSRDERRKLKRAASRLIRDTQKGIKKPASNYDPKL